MEGLYRNPPLLEGRLLKRYKRFLADIELGSEIVTAHCPNSGSMLTCNEPGSLVMVSRSDNPRRKTAYTWELIFVHDTWVGINTNVPNRLVYVAIRAGIIPELTGYKDIKREVSYGNHSRIDLFLQSGEEKCFVEVKNVTLVRDRVASFPDAVTQRGTKHLQDLIAEVAKGNRAVMFYLVQRGDADLFRPAEDIDPVYASTLREAVRAGVEVLVYQARVTPETISIARPLEFEIE